MDYIERQELEQELIEQFNDEIDNDYELDERTREEWKNEYSELVKEASSLVNWQTDYKEFKALKKARDAVKEAESRAIMGDFADLNIYPSMDKSRKAKQKKSREEEQGGVKRVVF